MKYEVSEILLHECYSILLLLETAKLQAIIRCYLLSVLTYTLSYYVT